MHGNQAGLGAEPEHGQHERQPDHRVRQPRGDAEQRGERQVVGRPEHVRAASYRKIVPSSATASPAEASRTYFQAASAAPSVPSIATSSADTIVVTSIAIHSSARLLIAG